MAGKKSGKSKAVLPDSKVIADIASQSPAAAKHRPTHVTRQVRVDLTTQELATLSNQLAQAVGRLNEAESDKAQVLSTTPTSKRTGPQLTRSRSK